MSGTLGLIVARGGSKGLPGKNLRAVNGGDPLIAWTVRAGLAARGIDRLVLSSDDAGIREAALALGCEVPFARPARLATDEATAMDVIAHALAELPGHDRLVLLQPTSPARTARDIDEALALMEARGAPACVSVTPAPKPPQWMFHLAPGGTLRSVLPPSEATRRQDLPPAYVLNGAIYCARTDWLLEAGGFLSEGTVAHPMPPERSVDIDTLADFEAFEASLRRPEAP